MTSWQPDISRYPGVPYQALAEAIADAVRAGKLARGARLPPQRSLASRLGIPVATVSRAYALAEQRRLITGQVGRGTFVLDPANDARPAWNETGVIDLSRNLPAIAGQSGALAATTAQLSRSTGLSELLCYMPEAGHRRYRDAGAAWLRRVGLDVSSERIMITGGAQHAFAMTMLALARPNDTVLTERLTFPGIPEAIRLAGARPMGVAMDDEGVLPDELDRAARATGARLAVLTPTIHNPCTAMMSVRRRRAVAAILRARDMILIEDDVYGVLPETRPTPIAALAPEHTIYVVSASKCLTAGLGVGWLTAPAALQDRLGSVLHAISQSLPTLGPEIVTRWIEDGTAERLVIEQRAEAAARHAIAAECLRGFSWRGRRDSLHAFIELPESWRDEHFLAEAMRRGVIACSARAFAVDEQAAPNAIRVALGAPRDHETLKRALDILVQLATSGESARTLRRRVV